MIDALYIGVMRLICHFRGHYLIGGWCRRCEQDIHL